ncbi:molybdenum ABC transporter ATP-binding protein [Pseudomonas massiliensis]|uniref:molybdenum ABC transporter ATP-binding protein n=1 Tax=Pseudomonas massiliensis TaxID=522492 RepID=UPI00058DEFD2|nr:molybdenum ABC transporter ATP-binding protein [Pseudomonas massiliensis]
MSEPLELEVTLSRGLFSLQASLRLPGQGITAISGPSGSGKTSLLRWVAGLERAEHGWLRVDGHTWEDTEQKRRVATHRRALGYVFQEANLFAHLDVRANLAYGWRRLSVAQREPDWAPLCQTLGIGHLLARMPQGLSGGERQRVGIARALLRRPRLLLMDEPLAALDGERKADILPYLERLRETLAIPVLYVTHAAEEISRLADHLVLIDGGRVQAEGPLNSLLTRLDLPLARGLDAGVVIEGKVTGFQPQWQLLQLSLGVAGSLLRVPHGERPLGSRLRVRVLARDVSLSLDAHSQSSVLNRLPAVVGELSPTPGGADVLVSLDCQGTTVLARLTRYSVAHLGLRPGMAVWAQIKGVAVLA